MALPPVLVGSSSAAVDTLREIACTLEDRAQRMTSVAAALMFVATSDVVTIALVGIAGLLLRISIF